MGVLGEDWRLTRVELTPSDGLDFPRVIALIASSCLRFVFVSSWSFCPSWYHVLIAVVNVSLFPNGSWIDMSLVPQGMSSIPGRAYL